MVNFDKWTILRIIEVLLVLSCLIAKRVTDDEARSLFLYLQKLSREWSLLTNVTWDRIGSAVADATYGGYLIITFALLMGKIFGELPTRKRITEWILLLVGAILFIALGSLAFASIESLPHNLVDNAAILGTLSVLAGLLFLLDMGAPKAPKPAPAQSPAQVKKEEPRVEGSRSARNIDGRDVVGGKVIDFDNIEVPIEPTIARPPDKERKDSKDMRNNGIKSNGFRNDVASKLESVLKEPPVLPGRSGRSYVHLDPTTKGYHQMRNDDFDIPRRFGIYGKDVTDDGDSDETASIPPNIELHKPVWSHIRKEVAKYSIPAAVLPKGFTPDGSPDLPPSTPMDPGFVQYTAQHWGDSKKDSTKTPRHSPTTDV